jgi:hypothetical protein
LKKFSLTQGSHAQGEGVKPARGSPLEVLLIFLKPGLQVSAGLSRISAISAARSSSGARGSTTAYADLGKSENGARAHENGE